MSSAQRSLQAYRNALRATKLAFEGDLRTLTAARQQIKQGMLAQNYQDKSVDERIQLLDEVAIYLKRNIVQGRKQEDGKYFLNIHKETELGENDSVKKPKSTLGSPAAPTGGCCGGGNKVLNEKRA